MRVHGIEQLAAWVLADQGWKPEHIKQMKETGERRDVRLKKPMPLYFVYITAWATEDGVVQFRRDLYQKDGIGAPRRGLLSARRRPAAELDQPHGKHATIRSGAVNVTLV